MKVTVESKKGLKTNLKVIVDKKIIEEKIKIRLAELSKTANIKGFRPGKVPVEVLKRQHGQAIYGEILEKTLQETSAKAIQEKKIKVAGQPKLDLKSYGEGKDLNYTLEVDELPVVKLQSLDKIKFTDYEIKITDLEITKRIDEIAKKQNNFIDKKKNESARSSDLITFDYEASIDGKPFDGGMGKNTQIVLGKDLFIKGFDNQLIGSKKEETKNVNIVLPENYPKKEYANKKANFKCKILNIQKSEPSKINDEFAKSLGAKNLIDLKELVSKQIKNQYKVNLDALVKEDILDQLEKKHDIEIPKNLVDQEFSLITQNFSKEDLEKNKKKSEKIAKKRVKLGLILNQLGEANNLKVEEQEIRNEIQKQVQSMPDQQKQILDYYQKNPSAASSLRGSIYEGKILDFVKKKSIQTKKNILPEEAENILKLDHEKRHDHSHEHPKKNVRKTGSTKPKKTLKTGQKKIRKK